MSKKGTDLRMKELFTPEEPDSKSEEPEGSPREIKESPRPLGKGWIKDSVLERELRRYT